MRNLSLQFALLFLADLIANRMRPLKRLRMGKQFGARLTSLFEEIEPTALAGDPEAVPSLRPLISRHTDITRAITAMVDAYGSTVVGDEAQQQAAARLRAVVLEGHREAGVSAAQRTLFAKRLRHLKPELQDDLALFADTPLPQLLDDWIAVGVEIGEAQANRATRDRPGDRPKIEVLTELRSVVRALRNVISAELLLDAELPRDLEEQILGYLDELTTSRRRPDSVDEPADAPNAAVVFSSDPAPVVAEV